MNDLNKLAKAIAKFHVFINRLEKTPNLIVHQRIDQFYYMQKASELDLLRNELQEIIKKKDAIEEMLSIVYPHAVKQWSKDARWLNRLESNRDKKKAIL